MYLCKDVLISTVGNAVSNAEHIWPVRAVVYYNHDCTEVTGYATYVPDTALFRALHVCRSLHYQGTLAGIFDFFKSSSSLNNETKTFN